VDETDRLIGCGQIKTHGDKTRELASIAVRPERQGEGIGTAIITQLLTENEPPLYLTCRASMQPYYEKFGFRVLRPEEMPPYFRRINRLFSFFKKIARRSEDLRVMAIEEKAIE
jgi:N-acetylglutamate synthase-like GNAT family acetyltransferase